MNQELYLFTISLFYVWLYTRKTGWSVGGIVTPGVLVLMRRSPYIILYMLIIGVLIAFPLDLLTRRYAVFGKERICIAFLLSASAMILMEVLFPGSVNWFGWIIPGLIAADIQRQGLNATLSGVSAISIVSLLTWNVILWIF
ncbi:MAG: poly-gamma-glutamate biosynthesis protein PgsC/CapC [Deltaproteobacteria bacterium]|nr:poly-gamma-glutamate biosynthesis protein PgsC/CapC [Deltaproteobacteria bacterium]